MSTKVMRLALLMPLAVWAWAFAPFGSVGGVAIAQSWGGVFAGKISMLEVTDSENFGLRVSLAGISPLCAGGSYFAYLNGSDSNYKAYLSILLLARASDKPVTVYSNVQGGQCHIGYLTM